MIDDMRLDDRRFADLMRDAERIIRQRAPGWTDLTPGDPGITLVEVFAHITETLLYRLNRVPDKIHLTLLDLLGIQPLAPAAATVTLTFSRAEEEEGAIRIPAGTRVSDRSGAVTFETLEEVNVAPGQPADVLAIHGESVRGESLGTGSGEPGQSYTLRRPPVIRNADVPWNLAIGVEIAPGTEPARNATVLEDRGKPFQLWRQVTTFLELGPDDLPFLANRTTGVITFAPARGLRAGDAAEGIAVPGAGREVRAWYRRGGGRAGNVGAGTLTVLADRIAGITVTNRQRASGGEDGETLAEVVRRGRESVRVIRTAVTARDFERIALGAGGVARARAAALRERWSFAEPGIVDLQLVPRIGDEAMQDGAVTPEVLAAHQTAGLLERVEGLVADARPIGVGSRVSWTRCQPVAIAVRVVVSPAENPDDVAVRLRRRLNGLLSPQGSWPHGKLLRASDVYDALLAEPGVRYAERLSLGIGRAPDKNVAVLRRDPHLPGMVFAATRDGLFRSQDLRRGWELLDTGTEDRVFAALAVHPLVPGLVAAVSERADGVWRIFVSEDMGETWRVVEQLQNEAVYGLAFTASRVGARLLQLATRRAFRRLELAPGAASNNVQELTASGEQGGNGFFAIATARHPMDVSMVAIAAREQRGVLISRSGGAARSFELIPGSQGKDIRVLQFQTVGDRLFLWAGITASPGSEGEGALRIEARADGLDPAGWTAFKNGWRGGSCEGLDIAGNTVVAASNRAGVLTLDAAAAAPAWQPSSLDSGLPINVERSALLPLNAVALLPTEPAATLIAGADGGVFLKDGERFVPHSQTVFTDEVPLPRTWLYCSGEHKLEVVADLDDGER